MVMMMKELKKFKTEKQEVIKWLVKPKKERMEQRELADKLGITSKTIWKWKNDPEIADKVLEKKKEIVKVEDLVDIVDAQIKKAKKGSKSHAEFIFKWVGEIDDSKYKSANNVQINIDANIPRPDEKAIEIKEAE